MRSITMLGIITVIFATISASTPASACPTGYVQCGNACCPAR